MENKNLNPSSWALYIFTSQMWMFLYDAIWGFEGDMYLLFGLFLLISLPYYFKAGDMYHQTGDALSANFYYTSGFLFGGPLALSYIALYLTHIFPKMGAMDERIVGVIYLVFAVWCLPMIPAYLTYDKANCITWVTFMLWYIPCGLSYFVWNDFIKWANIILCAVSTLGCTYLMMSETYYLVSGKYFPYGKPFFEAKD